MYRSLFLIIGVMWSHITWAQMPDAQAWGEVVVRGEVMVEGVYMLTKKHEKLSDLVKQAQGLTCEAYPEGARLLRKVSGAVHPVGIELDRALLAPGSDYDVVLCEGDELIIPEYRSTVRISGVVMHPNTVSYKSGKKLGYYINCAGGYGRGAKKSKVYVVYMNGMVSKVNKYKSATIQPGCEIIVPSKDDSK